MTDNKNELKQVRDALNVAHLKEDWAKQKVIEALATLDRLSAPVGVKKIEHIKGIEEALKILNTVPKTDGEVEDALEDELEFVEMYEMNPYEKLEEVSAAYLELQNADHIADVVKMVVPDGYKLIPIEPTEEMLEKGWDEYNTGCFAPLSRAYKAMLSAAPTPAPTEIDLDALKREVGEYVSRHYPKSRRAVNFAIGILSATGRLKV